MFICNSSNANCTSITMTQVLDVLNGINCVKWTRDPPTQSNVVSIDDAQFKIVGGSTYMLQGEESGGPQYVFVVQVFEGCEQIVACKELAGGEIMGFLPNLCSMDVQIRPEHPKAIVSSYANEDTVVVDVRTREFVSIEESLKTHNVRGPFNESLQMTDDVILLIPSLDVPDYRRLSVASSAEESDSSDDLRYDEPEDKEFDGSEKEFDGSEKEFGSEKDFNGLEEDFDKPKKIMRYVPFDPEEFQYAFMVILNEDNTVNDVVCDCTCSRSECIKISEFGEIGPHEAKYINGGIAVLWTSWTTPTGFLHPLGPVTLAGALYGRYDVASFDVSERGENGTEVALLTFSGELRVMLDRGDGDPDLLYTTRVIDGKFGMPIPQNFWRPNVVRRGDTFEVQIENTYVVPLSE